MRTGDYLWDFVGEVLPVSGFRTEDEANSCGFMRVVECEFLVTCWHAVCSLLE